MPISTPTMVHPRNKRKTIWYIITALIIAGCIYTLPSKRSQISSSLTFGSGQSAGRPTELGDEPAPDLEEQEVLAGEEGGRGRFCSDEQWNRGNWVKREKALKSLEDVREAWDVSTDCSQLTARRRLISCLYAAKSAARMPPRRGGRWNATNRP